MAQLCAAIPALPSGIAMESGIDQMVRRSSESARAQPLKSIATLDLIEIAPVGRQGGNSGLKPGSTKVHCIEWVDPPFAGRMEQRNGSRTATTIESAYLPSSGLTA